MLIPTPPPVEMVFILDRDSEIRIENYDNSSISLVHSPNQSDDNPNPQPDQTYGFAFPTSISGMTSGSTQVIVAVTADAPEGQIDLSSVDASILCPYSPEALAPNTSLVDYPKFTHKINGSQIARIHVQRHQRR